MNKILWIIGVVIFVGCRKRNVDTPSENDSCSNYKPANSTFYNYPNYTSKIEFYPSLPLQEDGDTLLYGLSLVPFDLECDSYEWQVKDQVYSNKILYLPPSVVDTPSSGFSVKLITHKRDPFLCSGKSETVDTISRHFVYADYCQVDHFNGQFLCKYDNQVDSSFYVKIKTCQHVGSLQGDSILNLPIGTAYFYETWDIYVLGMHEKVFYGNYGNYSKDYYLYLRLSSDYEDLYFTTTDAKNNNGKISFTTYKGSGVRVK